MLLNRDLNNYCDRHSSVLDDLLYDLERESNLKTLAPQMISGSLQGKILGAISKMIRPDSILEIGTFTGYATLCLATGLSPEGRITTIEINPEIKHIYQKYFERSSYKNQIKAITGDALEIIPQLTDAFDLIFIDAAKKDNERYYNLALDILKPGGFILIDNVLWDGKVVHENPDKSTEEIKNFNDKVYADTRVENVMFPIRDGFNLIRKI